ncbi:MAG: His/Gly/Thr/Pro-type tRNA ligase C-terminal domain-containing protein, partial [Promethearchaeota archaeon]
RRLRSFVMPDMHTLCKDVKSSVEEFKSQYFLIKNLLDDLGIKSFIIFRATQDFYRENKEWIKELIKKEGQPALLELWEERYFYFVLKFERPVLSAQNRSATLSTNQIDVESSLEYMVDNEGKKRQKYNIHFTDIDGETKYPVILHNSPTGGLERILWGLIETAVRDKDKIVPGFRTWLSPIQVRILTISNEQHDYAEKILEILSKESYRVDFDDRNEKLGKKIRQSEIDWIPYTIILGKKEQEDQTISVRKRLIGHPIGPKKETSKNVNNIKLSELIEMLNEDTKGFPKHKLPKPFRKFSTKVSFRK